MFRRNKLFHMPNVYSYFDQSFIILNRVHDFYIDYIAQMVYIYKKEKKKKKKWSIENVSVGQGRYHFCALRVRIFNTGILYIETRRAPTYRRKFYRHYIHLYAQNISANDYDNKKQVRPLLHWNIDIKTLRAAIFFSTNKQLLLLNHVFEEIRAETETEIEGKMWHGNTHGHFCMASHID